MKVSVLMAVYNGAQFVEETILSILGQTYRDYEFIIINDGSTDCSAEIIHSFHDSRIVYIENDQNRGLIYSLNKGLSIASGEYIARIDADDIAYRNRLEIQIEYMDTNREVGISGGYVEAFGGLKHPTIWKTSSVTHAENFNQLLFTPCFYHPTVIIRKSIIEAHNLQFNPRYRGLEDYGFWVDAAQFTKLENIQMPLIKFRVHPQSVSRIEDSDIIDRIKYHSYVFEKAFELHKLPIPNENEFRLHFLVSYSDVKVKDYDEFSQAVKYMEYLFNMVKYSSELQQKVKKQTYLFFRRNSHLGIEIATLYIKNPLRLSNSVKSTILLFRDCLLRK